MANLLDMVIVVNSSRKSDVLESSACLPVHQPRLGLAEDSKTTNLLGLNLDFPPLYLFS